MTLVAHEETAAWLAARPAFQWDAGNSTKSEVKHGHSAPEIESMMDGIALLAGRIIEADCGEPRWLLLGTSAAGAPLALVVARCGEARGGSMAKRLGTERSMQNGASKTDATLKEFERRDLGGDIEVAGSAIIVRRQVMTSIRLDPSLTRRLKQRAARLGVGYQTLLKMIVTKHGDDEL